MINKAKLTTELAWSINLGQDQEIIDIRTQYDQQSQASEPEHVLPTAFGVEGVLIFKYLDSNMFAVTTQRKSDP